MTTEEIDQVASEMSDNQREQYITGRGWTFIGAGWFPPSGPEDQEMGGRIRRTPSGVYSLSTAIREQIAREDPDATPDRFGRYYHGTVEHDPRPDEALEVIAATSYTDAQSVAAGSRVDLSRLERARLSGLPEFKGRAVTRITDSLILAMVRQLAAGAADTAGEGERGGWLYESPLAADGQKVWLQDSGDAGGWTIMLASDY